MIEVKRAWTQKWLQNTEVSRSHRLVAFACVEGIFFSSSFCAIFWFKKRGLLHGLTQSNNFIARDEGLHWSFACEMLKQLRIEHRPDEVIINPAEIAQIITSAVLVELLYVDGCLPVRMIGMNDELMKQYVMFVADLVAVALDVPKIYCCSSPFEWMSMSVPEGKSNFFERQVPEYRFGAPADALAEGETILTDNLTNDYDY